MRLIDADALNVSDIFCSYDTVTDLIDVEVWIDKAPTVDAVEVVRCKDCKYSYEIILGPGCEPLCALVCTKGVCVDCIVPEDFYCSYGERKEVTHEET